MQDEFEALKQSAQSMVQVEKSLFPVPDGVLVTDTGATFPENMTKDEYVDFGRVLWKADQCLQWWLIDWMRFGLGKWGKKYKNIIELTPYSYGYLANMISVDNRLAERHDGVGYAHHAAVASLSPQEQKQILHQAAKNGWPVRRVQDEAKRSKHERTPGVEGNGEIKKIDRSIAYLGHVQPDELHRMNTGEREVVHTRLLYLLDETKKLLKEVFES
jgi:hypothetical protein